MKVGKISDFFKINSAYSVILVNGAYAVKQNPYMILGVLRILSYYLYSVASVVHVNTQHKKILKVINGIKELDEILPLPEMQLKHFVFLFISQAIYGYFVSLLYNLFVAVANHGVKRYTPLFGLALLLPETNNVYFLTFVMFIGFYLDLIHLKLKELQEEDDGLKKIKTVSSFQTESASKAELIEKFRILYGEINDMKEDVNDIYSVHVLMRMASMFIDLVFKIFVNTVIFKFGRPDLEILPKVKYMQIFVGTAVILLKTVMTIIICHNTAEKGKQMGVTVHRLFEGVKDVGIREEVH